MTWDKLQLQENWIPAIYMVKLYYAKDCEREMRVGL